MHLRRKASSAILILNGKVNLFRPFKAKTFEVKESAKLKRNSLDFVVNFRMRLNRKGSSILLQNSVNC